MCICHGTRTHLWKEKVVFQLGLFSKPLPGIPKEANFSHRTIHRLKNNWPWERNILNCTTFVVLAGLP